jgi:hypothetical protein
MVGQYLSQKLKLTFCYCALERQIFLTSKQDPGLTKPVATRPKTVGTGPAPDGLEPLGFKNLDLNSKKMKKSQKYFKVCTIYSVNKILNIRSFSILCGH